MGKPRIIDEFTDLPISKQKKYSLRLRRDGKCKSCGGELSATSMQYCEYHRQYHRDHEAKYRRSFDRNPVAVERANTVEQRKKIRVAMRAFLKEIDTIIDAKPSY